MAKRYYESKSRSSRENENHERQKYNDEHHADKDSYPRDMYRRPVSEAELYSGMPTGMRSGLEDDAMLHEDHRAIANLPQEVMIKPYPKVGPYMPEVLNDDVSGVDAQMDYDDEQRRSHFYPKKV